MHAIGQYCAKQTLDMVLLWCYYIYMEGTGSPESERGAAMVLRAKGGRRYVMNATEIAAIYATREGGNTMTSTAIDPEVQASFAADAIMIEDAANTLRKAIRDGDLAYIESLSRLIARKAKMIAEESAFQQALHS